MDDAGIRRRLDAIIALQLLLFALMLPGGSELSLVIGLVLALYVTFRVTISLLERQPGGD